jgi:Mitochondrial carrier protein
MTLVRRTSIPQDLDHHDECCVHKSDELEVSESNHMETTSIDEKNGIASTNHQTHSELDTFVSRISDVYKWPKEMRNMLAGGLAGIIAKSVVAPVDRIKILYQVSAAEFHFSSLPSVVRNIIREEGVTALWKGNSATLIRVFPYSGIQFMVYDRMKLFFLQRHDRHDKKNLQHDTQKSKFGLSPSESLCAGMVAGVISVIFTYPLDLTRAQLAVLKKQKTGPNKGFIRVLSDNYTTRGLSGLFRGVNLTLLGILPYSGIAFALNEQSKREVRTYFH